MKPSFLVPFGLALALLTHDAFAESLAIESGTVSFLATGKPGFLKIQSNKAPLTGTLTKTDQGITGTVSMATETFSTGIDMRDEHMKDKYLQVKTYPTAILKVTELAFRPAAEPQKLPFKGTLNFHGVEKPIEGEAVITGAKENLTINAKFSMTISDYNVDTPSFSGVKVADKVDVEASLITGLAK